METTDESPNVRSRRAIAVLLPRLDADGAALLTALAGAGYAALTMPQCLSLLARGVGDDEGTAWATTSSRETRGTSDDGRPLACVLHAPATRFPPSLPFPIGRTGFAEVASGRFGPSATVPADASAHVLSLARLGGPGMHDELASLSRRLGRRIRVAADEGFPDGGDATFVGYVADDAGDALVIRTRAWGEGLAVRFLLARDPEAVDEVRTFGVGRLVAASSPLVRTDDVAGGGPPIHLLREFAGRVCAVFPKEGRAMDSSEVMHEAVVLDNDRGPTRIVVRHDGSAFLRYGIEDVLSRAPPGRNAYWRTGQVAVEGDRIGFDVVFCSAAVERGWRYRSQAEVEGDHDLAVAVADALTR